MKSLTLRLPDELHAALVVRAEHTGRSLNSEVIRYIEDRMRAVELVKAVSETVRQEMRAEFEERRPRPFDPLEYMLKNGMERA